MGNIKLKYCNSKVVQDKYLKKMAEETNYDQQVSVKDDVPNLIEENISDPIMAVANGKSPSETGQSHVPKTVNSRQFSIKSSGKNRNNNTRAEENQNQKNYQGYDNERLGKNSLIPLVYQGFTRTKEKHILHQTEALKEEFDKIKSRVTEMKRDNDDLKNQIETEVKKASRLVNTKKSSNTWTNNFFDQTNHTAHAREDHNDTNLKKQIKNNTQLNKKRALEIDQIKKSIRYTNFNELKIQTELLEEELKRLKTACTVIKQEKAASIMKLSDRLKLQDILLQDRETKFKKMTEGLNSLKTHNQDVGQDISYLLNE